MFIKSNNHFRSGQTVWVRSLKDILLTLDKDGKHNGMPFMPEMINYCGRSFRISHLARRSCIEGHGIGFRSMSGTVFLDDLRCDGASHDGCQRGCRFFWKEAWLSDKPLTQSVDITDESVASTKARLKCRVEDRYFCQSTELAGASSQYKPPRLLWYLGDVWLGEMSLAKFLTKVFVAFLKRSKRIMGMDISKQLIGHSQRTDMEILNLQPGEWIQVKDKSEIETTLDSEGKNRGLQFDLEMLPYCGKRYRVVSRLQKIIHEETGRMVPLRNTVLLEDCSCHRFGCYRGNLLYWREIWLKRVSPPTKTEVSEHTPQDLQVN